MVRTEYSLLQRLGHWCKTHFFATPSQAIFTVLGLLFLLWAIPALLDWLVFHATFQASSGQDCHEGGACWAFIKARYRFILFGTYPYEEQWRALIAMVLLLGLVIISTFKRFWNRGLALIWIVGLIAVYILMQGGIFGLSFVSTSRWGGLPITLILTVLGLAFAFPLGVLLALGRRSDLPLVKAVCVIYIEAIRGVPLISLLFIASVMFPLFLPEGVNIDKLLRAQLAIIFFTAAYIAETVRGGLQAIPSGQVDAAKALGMSYWQQMYYIVLPQALRFVIAPLVGIFIGLLKDTSLVVIIGIYDLSLSAKTAIADPDWHGFSLEAYLFIAAIYFVLCYGMSFYSRQLEKQAHRSQKCT